MPSVDDWKDIAEATLKGGSLESLGRHHEDGLLIKPLYTEADRPAARSLARTDAGWQIAAMIEPENDAAILNRVILDELEGGVAVIMLAADQDMAVLPRALDGVLLKAVRFQATGGGWRGDAETLIKASLDGGVDPGDIRHVLAADAVDDAAAVADWLAAEGAAVPAVKPVTIDGGKAHQDGHGDVGELAIMLAQFAHFLRLVDAAGIPPEDGFARVHLRFALGADLYGGIAKTRAAQQVFGLFAQSCGVDPAGILDELHGVASARHLTRLDADTNILRGGTALLAMVIGGVGMATTRPHDWLTGSSAEARRLARNSHHIMAAEARLDQVVDPAAGSFYIERLTHDLAHAAWQRFQSIEAEGGITAAAPRLATEAHTASQHRQDMINHGNEHLLGVTRHPRRDTSIAPLVMTDGMARGGQHRPAAGWENLYEAHHCQHYRILCLDIGASRKAAEAATWIQLAGIDATVTQAENVAAAGDMITAARPHQLVLGSDDEDFGRLAEKSDPAITITPAGRFDGDKLAAVQVLLGGAP